MLFRKLLRLVLGIYIHFSQLTAVHSAYLTYNACINYSKSLGLLFVEIEETIQGVPA